MSSAEEHPRMVRDASGVEEEAAAWLVKRRDSGAWGEHDEVALNRWLDEDWSHRVAYWRLDAAWNSADKLGVLRWRDELRPRVSPLLMKLAAGIAVLALLGAGAGFLLRAPSPKTYQTAVGGRELVSFADGTQIELNTDTVLRTMMTTKERMVWLDRGEAYFQVKHNAAHPFVVMVGGHRVTDLGTKFLIRRDGARLEVALVEGRVRLSQSTSAKRTQTAMLGKGDEAVVAKGKLSVTQKTSAELANELSWRRGFLVFRHTSLARAAAEFNRYNGQKVVIADDLAASLTIDGTFLTDDPGAFTDAAQTVFGLRVTKRGNEIVISR